jgi:uncharacterized protein
MKKIGVISDTHLMMPDVWIEEIASNHFADVDFIIHSGDMVTLDIINTFTLLGKDVVAVSGNMDGPDVRSMYPASRTITVEDITIGVTHGWGSPNGIRQRIMQTFPKVDAIVYGHTHQAFIGKEAGIYFFNPGSPTDLRFTTDRTIGIIEVQRDTINGAIIIL